MTNLAVQPGVPALLFLLDDFSMAAFADFVASMHDGASGYFCYRFSTIVPVLTERFRNDSSAQDRESDQCDKHHGCEPKKVLDVLEQRSTFGVRIARLLHARRKRNDLRYRESVGGTMIEVTEEGDASHASDREQRRDWESFNEFGCMRWQRLVLAADAIAMKWCDGNHMTRNFIFRA